MLGFRRVIWGKLYWEQQNNIYYIQLKLDLRKLDADGNNDPKMFSQMVVIVVMAMNTMVQSRKSH